MGSDVVRAVSKRAELDFLQWTNMNLEIYRFQVLDYDIEVTDTLIAEALHTLTEKKRNVVLLSYFMDMSDADIARKMNLVRSTISEHRKRSLELMRKIMEETNEKN